MPSTKKARTFVTEKQAAIHALFVRYRSMSTVARMLGLTQIRVREALVQVERNRMRDKGISPPPLREMMRGDVTTRFGVPRLEYGGRPAKHRQDDFAARERETSEVVDDRPSRIAACATSGVVRLVITSAETGCAVHMPFWTNLKAYAGTIGAELVVLRRGESGLLGPNAEDVRRHVRTGPFRIGASVDVAADVRASIQATRPLDGLRSRRDCEWTIFPHAVEQLETLPRVREDGLRMHMTTGAVTMPDAAAGTRDWRREVGAVVVEVAADGAAFCRHLQSPIAGDGSFQDLDRRVGSGVVATRCRVEALTFGDLHHAQLDPRVAAATWGVGATSDECLVDALRPRAMIFHDICDFAARNHHEAKDHHGRFALMASGRDCVRSEMAAVSRFLEETRRSWSTSVVVGSNHDEQLVRWLREADFRADPANAVFFLEASLALHRRLAAGGDQDGFFEEVLRGLSADTLAGVRFLGPDESFKVAGVECAVHGHRSTDGRRGGMSALEALGIRMTIGHTHRPSTRGGVCGAGVCQQRLSYSAGPLTSWAVGHVVTYEGGARQHLVLSRGRFRP